MILNLDIITSVDSLNLRYVKVDHLRRREEESSQVGMNKEDSSFTTITHRYKRGNGRETEFQGKRYLQGKAKFHLEHEGEGLKDAGDVADNSRASVL